MTKEEQEVFITRLVEKKASASFIGFVYKHFGAGGDNTSFPLTDLLMIDRNFLTKQGKGARTSVPGKPVFHIPRNSIRINTANGDNGYPRNVDDNGNVADDSRFVEINTPVKAIATSSSQNDNGMFEMNFRDERYLPFEGSGVISDWSLELFHDLPSNNPDPRAQSCEADGPDNIIGHDVQENGRHRAADRTGAGVGVNMQMIAHKPTPFFLLRVRFFLSPAFSSKSSPPFFTSVF